MLDTANLRSGDFFFGNQAIFSGTKKKQKIAWSQVKIQLTGKP